MSSAGGVGISRLSQSSSVEGNGAIAIGFDCILTVTRLLHSMALVRKDYARIVLSELDCMHRVIHPTVHTDS